MQHLQFFSSFLFNFISLLSLSPNNGNVFDGERTGIADGWEFEIRPPGTAAWLFDKVKYLLLKLDFIRQAGYAAQ